ncbi:MAG: lysine--tRNA ligase [Nanoarchaeota archaeon]|nr:lysine--tRNA ligase [Nanoarchaeota archaeon]
MENIHWADQFAAKVIREKGDKDSYTVAAGITPSGTIHIGNFREVITVDLIAKALENKGKKVRFIYSWDDCDVFRKVPKNLPKQDLLKDYLRKPLFLIPDVFNKFENYAAHNKAEFEKDLPLMNINPEFIHQYKKYIAHDYAEGIKIALEHTDKIKEILNEFRKEPLADSWLPVFVFCDKCSTDKITKLTYKGDYNLNYECECGNKQTIDFRKEGIVTLKWRVDWPMRWDYENVDFEPAGKDHFAAGGSRATGELIQKAVYGTEPPFGFVYEWIAMKGGKQFASSSGDVITLAEMLSVYQSEIIRYLFAGTRPNAVFEISFDLDIFKIYEDFDKCERIYFKEQEAKNEKEYFNQKRIYELSAVGEIPKKMPIQPSFRHMKNIVQICSNDMGKIIAYLKPKNDIDKQRIITRANCAINWLKKYASEDMKFIVQTELPLVELSDDEKNALIQLSESLIKDKFDNESLFNEFYNLVKANNLKTGDFFKAAYSVIINKQKGPKLAPFILEIGQEKISQLLSQLKP